MFDYTHILPVLYTMITVVCLGGSVLLFLRSHNNRSRWLLAIIMLLWGLFYMIRLSGLFLEHPLLNFTSTSVMNPGVLVSGNLFLIILLFYPIEVVRPGWLNLKRTGLLLLPYVLVSLFYYLVLYLLGQTPMKLSSIREFVENITCFNVGYRIFMNLSVLFYLVFLLLLTRYYKSFYREWCLNNYSNIESMDVSWLRQYGIGVFLVGLAYFFVLLDGNTYSLITHNLTVQCFFAYTLYKGLFHDNPYTENFFKHSMNEAEACHKARLIEEKLYPCKVSSVGGDSSFLKKLPAYHDEVATWMMKEKPYLNPNFKLMDVSHVLPLNRTYISRVFNEGFGGSFSDVVRDYRIREAEHMLVNCKDISVGQIAELCGFSSPSVFHRTFVQSHNGVTPNRYRKQSQKQI